MKKNISQTLIKNILWNFLGNGCLLAVSVFATPYIVHRLNVNLFGIYMLVGATIGYLGFLQLGLGSASVKYISECLVNAEESKITKIFWSCVFSYIFLGLLGSAIIALFAQFAVEKIFKIPAEFKEIAIFVLRVGSLGFLLSFLTSVLIGTIQAAQRFDILNGLSIALGILQIAITVILLELGYSLKEIVIAWILLQLIAVYIYWIYVNKIFKFLKKPAYDIKTFVLLFKFGGFVTISSIVGPILINIEKIFLTSLNSLASLTYYLIPFALVDKIAVLRSSVSSVIFPAFSSLDDSRQKNISEELHYESVILLLFLYIFFTLLFIILGRSFLSAWIGIDFANKSQIILRILAFSGLINVVAVPSMLVLQGKGKPHIPAAFHVIETILYVPLSYFLIYRMGGLGAAIAWLIRVVLDTLLLNRSACGLLGENIFFWYYRIIRHIFIPLALCGLLLWLIKGLNLYFFSAFNLVLILANFAVFCLAFWRYGLDSASRGRIIIFLSSLKYR